MLFDKVTKRLRRLCDEVEPRLSVDPARVTRAMADAMATGMTTEQIDDLAASTAYNFYTIDPEYESLAARIAVSNYHKRTSRFERILDWVRAARDCHETVGAGERVDTPLVTKELLKIVEQHHERIDAAINHSDDYALTYFGFATLTGQSYLLKVSKQRRSVGAKLVRDSGGRKRRREARG